MCMIYVSYTICICGQSNCRIPSVPEHDYALPADGVYQGVLCLQQAAVLPASHHGPQGTSVIV